MNTNEPCYIFSVENGISPSQDTVTTDIVREMLRSEGVFFKPMHGRYKGKDERSMLVSDRHAGRVMELARAHHQESVLYLDANRGAWLLDPWGKEKDLFLGQWREAEPGEVPEACTIDPETGRVWVAGLRRHH